MRQVWRTLAGLCTLGLVASAAQGAGPTVQQVLALKPVQADVVCDTPSGETVGQCKLEVLKKPASGWVLRDHRGLVVRKFVDANNDNVVDSWSFFTNGQEVYRDVDSNHNGKADQYRWFHAGGSRWALDENEDGLIDRWKEISAEEAGAEAVAAMITRNFDRLKLVLLADDDLKTLGMSTESTTRIQKSLAEANAKFQRATLPKSAQFTRFDGHSPMTVPAADAGGSQDLLVYCNVTLLADANGQTAWMRVPEVVKVGSTWKLSDVPSFIDPNKAVPSERVLMPALDQAVVNTAGAESEDLIEDSPEVQKHVTDLQQLDQQAPNGNEIKKLISYHVKRAEICAHIGSKSKKLKNREHWYKQTADSLNAAAQTNEYPQGIATLSQYADQFAKTTWGKTLAAYFKYRSVNAAYAMELNKPGNDHAKAQQTFLAELKKYLDAYPGAEDTADALWQLGNGTEFSGAEDQAKEYYRRLTSEFPKAQAGAKAAGAIRRLDAVGQPLALSGGMLGRTGRIDASQLRGKVVLVQFWATWCEPCKAEMPRMTKLRDRYKNQGFEILGVCLDANKQNAENFVAQVGAAWPNIYEEGSMESVPAIQYGIISLPYMMLVDPDGRVLNKNLNANQLEAELEKAMSKKIATRQQ